jgi:hypothetical protein
MRVEKRMPLSSSCSGLLHNSLSQTGSDLGNLSPLGGQKQNSPLSRAVLSNPF